MSAAVAAAAAAAAANRANRRKSAATTSTFKTRTHTTNYYLSFPVPTPPQHSRLYETKKRQDLNTFAEYIRNQYYHYGQPSVSLRQCNGSHVVGFLKYLDQFGETKVHNNTCKYYGQAHPPAACGCPLKQASSSLDAVVSRVRAAFEELGGSPETNPFNSPVVCLYLMEVKECQRKARGLNNG